MQIVIDIDVRAYNKCLKLADDNDGGILGMHLINAVANGTLLPKGHGRLIDADALGEKEECYLNEDESISFFYVYSEDIIYAPTIVEADKEGQR